MVNRIAVIGGSGLESLAQNGQKIESVREPDCCVDEFIYSPELPFDAFYTTVKDIRIIYIPRHGVKHQNLPLDVPYKKIMEFLHEMKVNRILAFSATGTLDETVALANEKSFVVPDSFIRGFGFTPISARRKDNPHADVSRPFDQRLRTEVLEAGRELGDTMTDGGIYILDAGHNFETPAEIAYLNAVLSIPGIIRGLDSLASIVSELDRKDSLQYSPGLQKLLAKIKNEGLNPLFFLAFPGMEHLSRRGAQVGMTAVYEAILAAEYRIPYVLVACPVNLAAGMSNKKLDHENDTLRVIEESKPFIYALMEKSVERIS